MPESKYRPYPPRTTVAVFGLHVIANRGATLLRSGRIPEREVPFVPTRTISPVDRSSVDMPLAVSTGGDRYSYRMQNFRVTAGRTRQSSCAYAAYALVRIAMGFAARDWRSNVGRPSSRSPIPLPVNAPVNDSCPRENRSTVLSNRTFRNSP